MSPGSLTLIALEADRHALAAIQEAASDGSITLLALMTDLDSLIRVVAERRPSLVLLDLAFAGADPMAAVRSVVSAAPEACVVVTGADVTPSLISRAVSAGARGFILRPFRAEEITTTLRDAHQNLTDLRRLQRGDAPATREQRGQIVAVYSPKGGVGCTTIATNLAVALAGRSKKPVGIVDLDLQFGDVGVALDLQSANSVIDLVSHNDVDAALIDDVFVKHESGLRVLVAPQQLGAADGVDATSVVRSVEGLRDHFAFVVCDLGSSLDDLSLGILHGADHVLLVTTPEIPSLKNIRRALAATPALNDERVHIVLNRHPSKAGISIPDVERNLGRRVSATVPSDGVGVTEAINQGMSMFDSRSRGRARRSYTGLAETLLRNGAPPRISETLSVVKA